MGGRSVFSPPTRHRLLAASGGLFCLMGTKDHHISRALSCTLFHTYGKNTTEFKTRRKRFLPNKSALKAKIAKSAIHRTRNIIIFPILDDKGECNRKPDSFRKPEFFFSP